MEQLFNTGQIYLTCGVNNQITNNAKFAIFISDSLNKHIKGEWGEISEDDKEENHFSLSRDLRLFSAYERKNLPKIWIITEADRSVTTVLFPDEY